MSDFLRSNALKSLLVKVIRVRFLSAKKSKSSRSPGSRGQSRFLSVPPEIASAYWLWQAHRGKKAALALCVGLITESLKRRLDEAFGVTLREGGRNELRSMTLASSDRSLGTRSRTNNTDSPADCTEGELEPGRLSKSFGPVSRCF